MTRRYLEGLGLLVGMIFGAGAFALPYSVSKSGIFWGGALFGTALFFILILHLRFGEVVSSTKGSHRFAGYTRLWLGKRAEYPAVAITLFSYYGTLLIYVILGGVFLSNLLPFLSQFWWSIIFLGFSGALISMNIEKIGAINFYLTVPLFLFILFIAWLSFPHFKTGNLLHGSNSSWFLPYGVSLFALSGFSVIPEVRDILKNSPPAIIQKVIAVSIFICALFYVIFTISVLGVSGSSTSSDAISSLGAVLGKTAIITGSLIGLLAVFTSHLALGTDLRSIFYYDYKFSFMNSWVLSATVPVVLFLAGATNFVKTISLVGSLGLGITGLFIIAMARKLRMKEMGVNSTAIHFNKTRLMFDMIVAVGLVAGVFYEIINIF